MVVVKKIGDGWQAVARWKGVCLPVTDSMERAIMLGIRHTKRNVFKITVP